MQEALFCGMDAAINPQDTTEPIQNHRAGAVRMRLADRSQVGMHFCSIDELIPADHQVRVIWDAVCQMDLSGFEASIQTREFTQGRSANDVRVMVGLWLWAAVRNVPRGRLLERMCLDDLTFKWMCGGLSMNYHTLNDFRVGHCEALDQLFTAILGRLMQGELVTVTRISQDGLRTRASAAGNSFGKQSTLEACLAEAEAHLADLKKVEESPDNQNVEQGNQQLAIATDRLNRVRQALLEIPKVASSRAKLHDKKKRENPPRASTTDPEARFMKMPNGGFNPAYNVQLATDPTSRAIVGVEVSNSGSDVPQSEPMREQVEQRTGQKVSEHLIDGGYVSHETIDRATEQSVTIYAPVAEPSKNAKVIDRFARHENDTDAVADWRTRMSTDAAKEIYQQRTSTSETVNADMKAYRGLASFAVRGIAKATCVVLWSALAYNLMHFASALT
jgi:transposase